MIKTEKANYFINKIIDNPNWSRCDIEWEAILEIKELLDKETPMKANKSYCGFCKRSYLVKSRGDKYCYICGQKIDWSNE